MSIVQIETNKQENCISEKIFEKACSLFFSIGIRNTTMDDLAKELGISKKTLYKEFDNKADLVRFCVAYELKKNEKTFQERADNTENAIEELVLSAVDIHADLQQFHPSIIQDLMKFYPESWNLIEHHRDIFAKNNIENNLKKGIKQGVYRKDINIEIVAALCLQLSFFSLHFDHKGHQVSEVYLEVLRYNVHAIATQKGIELFEQLIKKIKV
jgi:AcrR family transcriptional regulator